MQFSASTWGAYGGTAYAFRADLATRVKQITAAERVLHGQGWGAWPACSRKLHLTAKDAAGSPFAAAHPPRPFTPGDFDGNGRADMAVWRPSTGTWLRDRPPRSRVRGDGRRSVAGNFDGNRRSDVAVWRRSTGTWYVRGNPGVRYGDPTAVPVVGQRPRGVL